MGCYNTYGGVQLKVESEDELLLHDYRVGQKVPLEDGVYVGHEGVVVITGNRLTETFPHLTDKWGGVITPEEIIDARNPIKQAVEQIRKEGQDGG